MPRVCATCGSDLEPNEPKKQILILGSDHRLELEEMDISDHDRFLFKVMEGSRLGRAYLILSKDQLACIIRMFQKVIPSIDEEVQRQSQEVSYGTD